jgi:hypothetical protein
VLQLVGNVGSFFSGEVDLYWGFRGQASPGGGEEGLAVGGIEGEVAEEVVDGNHEFVGGRETGGRGIV